MEARVVKVGFDWHDRYAISQAWRVGDLVFTSGQAAIAQDGSLVGAGDFSAQAEQAFANLPSSHNT